MRSNKIVKANKSISVFLFICMLFACVFALSACHDDLPDNSAGVEITLMVLDQNNTNVYEKKLITTKSSLLESLKEFEGLAVLSTSNFLGSYINSVSVGSIEESEYGKYFNESLKLEGSTAARTYIAIYHDIDDATLKDLTSYSNDLPYEGKSYFYSGVSVNALPLYDGASYILKLCKY